MRYGRAGAPLVPNFPFVSPRAVGVYIDRHTTTFAVNRRAFFRCIRKMLYAFSFAVSRWACFFAVRAVVEQDFGRFRRRLFVPLGPALRLILTP